MGRPVLLQPLLLPVLLPMVLAALGSGGPPAPDERACNVSRQASCGRQCIPLAWLCNGEQECPEGVDEQCDAACHGDPLAWQCDDGKCISVHWVCDGVGDCLDGSDEMDCVCSDQKVQCPGSSQCINAWEICDLHEDCDDGLDEADCAKDHCQPGQWQCRNGMCVMDYWKCDGVNHCGDSSDEDVCALCPGNMVRCDEGKCILESLFCSGVTDCLDGTDEPVTCGKNCSQSNGGCMGHCNNTDWGVQCSCGPGWQLQADGQSCVDVDECSAVYSPCGQLCHNSVGSFTCDCVEGYQLLSGRDCQVADNATKILVAADEELAILDIQTGAYQSLAATKTHPAAVAYDLKRGLYYWIDKEKIVNVFVLGKTNSIPLYPELKSVNSIAVDWFTGQLYWASSEARVIWAGLPDGRGYVKILEKDLTPEQLNVFPAKRYLYWVNRERGRMWIEAAGMDGSDRHVLAVVTMEEPFGLTLDYITGRLYWISEYKESLETVKVDGRGRHSFPQMPLEEQDPVGLAVFENWVFWADKLQVLGAPRRALGERMVLLNASISALAVLHKLQQHPNSHPVCMPGSCSHLCLLSPIHPQGYKCACPEGLFLSPAGQCIELKLVFSSGKKIFLLKVGFLGMTEEKTLLQEHPKTISLLDYDWKRDTAYWIDDFGHLMYSTGSSGKEILTDHPVCSASVDISTGDLYWLPCDRKAIQVTRATDLQTRMLYHSRSGVLRLLLDWPRGWLYWVERDKPLQGMQLNGQNVQEIWNGTWQADTPMALDMRSSNILWTTEDSGLQVLSLAKRRASVLDKSWTHKLAAAYAPYLVSVNQSALTLWDRRTMVPFSARKEPGIGTVLAWHSADLQAPAAEARQLTASQPPVSSPPSSLPPPPPPPLFCRRSFFLCHDGNECVSHEFLCDGEWDCRDGSDEENCSELCSGPGIFQCLNGNQCVEERYRCDGVQQCPDGSDEHDCWQPTEDCALRCDNHTHCVPRSWLCDGSPDCNDWADERECGHKGCNPLEFRCTNGQCISLSLRCDGDRDCGDHSDEEGCPVRGPHQCRPGEGSCRSSGECVLSAWICDGDVDCRDGTDEQDCPPRKAVCKSKQWPCHSGDECVPGFWRCDAELDCKDGSDEIDCDPRHCSWGEFQCGSLTCLATSRVCDGHPDCTDGTDEGGQCASPACSDAHCSHTCFQTPSGPRCACPAGFKLSSSGRSCRDVNECEELEPRPCAQTCINSEGAYSCACHPGYQLEQDGQKCKVTGSEPVLLVAVQFSLLQLGLRSRREEVLLRDNHQNVFAVDYDLEGRKVFWTDLKLEAIKWISLDTKKSGTVVKGTKPDCIATDWVGRNLYWTEGQAGRILANPLQATWRGKTEYTVVLDGLHQPRALAVAPRSGLMFWSETGSGDAQIKQAGLDGSGTKVLISQGLGWPIDLALDPSSWKIFWADEKLHSIGSVSLDGTGIRVLQLDQIQSPYSLTVFENEIYWSDMKARAVQRVRSLTGKNRTVLLKRHGQPYGLKIMHEVLQPKSPNPCLDLGCSHMCLLSPRAQGSCHCPVGLLLAADGLHCISLKESAFLFLVSSSLVTQVYLKKLKPVAGQETVPEHRVLPFTELNRLVTVDYEVKQQVLYFSDWSSGAIRLLRLSESARKLAWETVVTVEGTIVALALDWLSGNVYWIDGTQPHISVGRPGAQSGLPVVWKGLTCPSELVLHPPTARMCFVEGGSPQAPNPRIECCAMDGSRREVLWQRAQVPVGLSFAESGTRLFWADSGRGVIESVQRDGTGYRVDRQGLRGLQLFTVGEGMMFWTMADIDGGQKTKVWYSKMGRSEDWWFQVDQKIVALKTYSAFSQQGRNACSKDNGGCSYICLPNPEGKTCKCPAGYYVTGVSCAKAVQCPAPSQPCKDGRTCVSPSQMCNGQADCPDGSDETNCLYSGSPSSTAAPLGELETGKRATPASVPVTPRRWAKTGTFRPTATKYSAGRAPTTLSRGVIQTLAGPSTKDSSGWGGAGEVGHPPCSSEACSGRGICVMEGQHRKCNCELGYSGDFCEEEVATAAARPQPGHVVLGIIVALSVLAIIGGPLLYIRRQNQLKRTSSTGSSRILTNYRISEQEEETLELTGAVS
ncbi:low-density lipoprotein receptor-related protein 2-like isoform X2 [Ornithorhynchus anatinus]|uniref:low-density lipoprotein receptor-related protein 2-like isoform X2 n=1 Tax=Ornithorhynchus anatinus TaxID=9258 RepID=UPI0019D4C813|nr:low-density lipoprotein receptor-related protein 2-like isoform X2 [Ornithorhynchus anatinus]